VLRSDTFGNLILDAAHEQLTALGARLGDTLTVSHEGASRTARYAATFAEVTPGELLIYEDATRMVAIAVNRGSAAELLGAGADDELVVRPA
jgi:S-adenosylmethionine hydrolase